MQIIQKPVKNFAVGRKSKPEIIVIHVTDSNKESAYNWFNNPQSMVSAHYLVCRNREIWQMVEDSNVAWANGLKVNPTALRVLEKPTMNPNEYSLSIEVEGQSWSYIPETQYEDIADLVLYLSNKWGIPINNLCVIGHNSIRQNKRCPLPVSVDKILKIAIEKKNLTYSLNPAIIELSKQIANLWDLLNSFRSVGRK